jgi:hypothetical protein
MAMIIKHPAKFSDPVLERIEHLLDLHGWPTRIIDPFAGTGKVHQLAQGRANVKTVGVEIEPEWVELHPDTIIGDALHLSFPDNTFNGLISSPCYGNRYADHHNAQDGSVRRSYTHDIGRQLHAHNAGSLQWGDAYRSFHAEAWTESLRVLQPDALIVVNISNHVRGGKEQLVTEWHLNWFMANACQIVDLDRVSTVRMRYGANRDARSRFENVLIVRYQPT